MSESQYLSVIRVWAAMAWADGVIADEERAAIKRLVGVAELSEEERATALGWLETRVDADASEISGLSDEAREGIYRAALRLAMVDLEVAPEERAYLAKLREGLSIDDAAVARIENSIKN